MGKDNGNRIASGRCDLEVYVKSYGAHWYSWVSSAYRIDEENARSIQEKILMKPC